MRLRAVFQAVLLLPAVLAAGYSDRTLELQVISYSLLRHISAMTSGWVKVICVLNRRANRTGL